MERHYFLLINDILYRLYSESSLSQIKLILLTRLKQLIPYSFASIFMCQNDPDGVTLLNPVCHPASFQKTEETYIRISKTDHMDGALYSSESELVRESELMDEKDRLTSPVYRNCYNACGIYDRLQLSIIYEKKLYAVLTLYRTRSDGAFKEDEMFYIRSLSRHLNYIFYQHIEQTSSVPDQTHLVELIDRYHLTGRESQILEYVKECLSNEEILERIHIKEHTLQKHLQNLYNKCGVSTRWDLLKL